MTSRERVKRAVHFQNPDRIPHYLPDGLENDILWLAPWTMGKGTAPLDIQGWKRRGTVEQRIDAWGVTWERTIGNKKDIGQAKRYPIEDLSRQAAYEFPPRNNRRYYRNHKQAIEQNRFKYVLGVLGFASLNEGVHNVIGLENMFVAYYQQPAHLNALVARFAQQQRQSIKLMADLGCDGIMVYDDWGLQDRLMIKKSLIKSFFMPHYRRNWAFARELGLDVWLHSCGYIIDLLPDFHQAGLNVIQMDQQENMGLQNLSHTVGGQLAFWCPVDIQHKIHGAFEEIELYVKKMMATLGAHQGGLISMAYTTPEAINLDADKIKVMCKAFRRYGRYG